MKALRPGLLSLCLLMSLTGCVTAPPTILLRDCTETEVQIETNADLARKAKQLQYDLASCNADKAALRAFYNKE